MIAYVNRLRRSLREAQDLAVMELLARGVAPSRITLLSDVDTIELGVAVDMPPRAPYVESKHRACAIRLRDGEAVIEWFAPWAVGVVS